MGGIAGGGYEGKGGIGEERDIGIERIRENEEEGRNSGEATQGEDWGEEGWRRRVGQGEERGMVGRKGK